MKDRSLVREMAREHLAKGDPTGWFEPLYALAAGDASAIPWADLAPNVNLLDWLDDHPIRGEGRRALVVGCGLGDDAEELARRGFTVTAFDVAPTAIAWCKKRFESSTVTYVVADVLAPPPKWTGSFDFVLESYTLQALPQPARNVALAKICAFVAPRGELLVICRGRDSHEPEGEMPWFLTRQELGEARSEGLAEKSLEDYLDLEDPPVRRFRALYAREA